MIALVLFSLFGILRQSLRFFGLALLARRITAMSNLGIVTGTVLLLFSGSLSPCAADMTYLGKVVETDTLQPIEGAVVVAIWNQQMADIAGTDVIFKDSKETLTDRNGEWTIVGPKGEEMHYLRSFLLRKYYLGDPYFIIYKPGYWGYGTTSSKPGGFRAYPYINKERNLEGIILERKGETWEQVREYDKNYGSFLPLIQVEDAERKLRSLEFSIKYPENVMRIGKGIWKSGYRPFWVYTVVGLVKAETREERLQAFPSRPAGETELPLLNKLLVQEKEELWKRSGR